MKLPHWLDLNDPIGAVILLLLAFLASLAIAASTVDCMIRHAYR